MAIVKADAFANLDKRVYLGDREESSATRSNVRTVENRLDKQGMKSVDKANRATTEQVLDPRTRLMLFKMLSGGIIDQINGYIAHSTNTTQHHTTAPPHSTTQHHHTAPYNLATPRNTRTAPDLPTV
jgi:hypothetical protein